MEYDNLVNWREVLIKFNYILKIMKHVDESSNYIVEINEFAKLFPDYKFLIKVKSHRELELLIANLNENIFMAIVNPNTGLISIYNRNIIIGINNTNTINFIQLNHYMYEYNDYDELVSKLNIINIDPRIINYLKSATIPWAEIV